MTQGRHKVPPEKPSYSAVVASDKKAQEEKEKASYAAMEAERTRRPAPEDVLPLLELTSPPETDEERRALFEAMLQHYDPGPAATWNEYVLHWVKDVRYKAVKGMDIKLQIFREYMAKVKVREEEREKASAYKALEAHMEIHKASFVGLSEEDVFKALALAPAWERLAARPEERAQAVRRYTEKLAQEVERTKASFFDATYKEAFSKVVRDKLKDTSFKADLPWDHPEIQLLFAKEASVVYFAGTGECRTLFDKLVGPRREQRQKELDVIARQLEVRKKEVMAKLSDDMKAREKGIDMDPPPEVFPASEVLPSPPEKSRHKRDRSPSSSEDEEGGA